MRPARQQPSAVPAPRRVKRDCQERVRLSPPAKMVCHTCVRGFDPTMRNVRGDNINRYLVVSCLSCTTLCCTSECMYCLRLKRQSYVYARTRMEWASMFHATRTPQNEGCELFVRWPSTDHGPDPRKGAPCGRPSLGMSAATILRRTKYFSVLPPL